jgi:hypothetical protein
MHKTSSEVIKACQVFTTSCNTVAMSCLQKDDYVKAYELLKKAELLTEARGEFHRAVVARNQTSNHQPSYEPSCDQDMRRLFSC